MLPQYLPHFRLLGVLCVLLCTRIVFDDRFDQGQVDVELSGAHSMEHAVCTTVFSFQPPMASNDDDSMLRMKLNMNSTAFPGCLPIDL